MDFENNVELSVIDCQTGEVLLSVMMTQEEVRCIYYENFGYGQPRLGQKERTGFHYHSETSSDLLLNRWQ